MLLVARKNLFSERTRLAISVGGVALSVFLISLLLSLYRGWDSKVGEFVQKSNVDIWIASEGSKDFASAASLLPTEGDQASQAQQYLNGNSDVEAWSPMIVRPLLGVRVEKVGTANENLGTEMNLQFVGFDTAKGLGGPIEIVEGKNTPGPSEVIIDSALAKRYGLNVGDTLRAGGKDWKVVGRAEFGDFVFSQTVFVTLDEAQAVLQMKGYTTFYVLKLKPGVDAAKFAGDINKQGQQIVAYTHDQFAANTRERILGNVLPILSVVLGLAFVVGLAIAGLTIYTATIEKSREFGIIKAVGFRNSYLYRLVFEQSVVTGFLGFIVGLTLTLVIGPFASNLVPQFVLYTRWQDVLIVAAATILMSLLAAYIPIRRLTAIDPVAAFKA
jgi:putative ABC transport system permease protein